MFMSAILRLILPGLIVSEVEAEAKRQGVSVRTLVRSALEYYLGLKRGQRMISFRLPLTPEDRAHEVMRIFREEDR